MFLQYLLNKHEEIVVLKANLLRRSANFLSPALLLFMYVCRQLNNEPAEIHIKVTSFSGKINQRENTVFFQKTQNPKRPDFSQILWGGLLRSKKISSFEELFHGNFLFCLQLETKS